MEFRANTFEEIAMLSQMHGKEMFQKGDKAHLDAMNSMRELMHIEDGMTRWMEQNRTEFAARPDTEPTR